MIITPPQMLITPRNAEAARLIQRKQVTAVPQPKQWSKALYADYLQSAHWQAFRIKALAHYEHKCMLCGETDRPLELHHNDYSRLGGELLTDVLPLCDDCHGRHHGEF